MPRAIPRDNRRTLNPNSAAQISTGIRQGTAGQDITGREEDIKKRFAQLRTQLGAGRGEAERQSRQQSDRFAAITGRTGGAVQKARQQALTNVGRQFAEVGAGLGAQEAAAQQELKGEQAGRQAAAEESALARQQQQEQFKATLGFQENSFAQTMAFQWAEMNENLKTNFVNAAIALKDSGLRSSQDWESILGTIGVIGAPKGVNVGPARIGGQAELERLADSTRHREREAGSLGQPSKVFS